MGRGKGKGIGHGGGGGEGGGGMLHAQRSALQATLTENVIKLQAQELQYYSGNYSMIGTMSSILAGFAFTGGLSASTAYNGWLTPWLTEVRLCATRSRRVERYPRQHTQKILTLSHLSLRSRPRSTRRRR